jgi:hypothetical protein
MSSFAPTALASISQHALDSAFKTAESETGETTVQFGDGVHGAALPLSSHAMLNENYAVGSGASGNVAAGTRQHPELLRPAFDVSSLTCSAQLERIVDLPAIGHLSLVGRTVDADSASMYFGVRRYLAYLESSISLDLQFAVFEPNDPRLWGTVCSAISDFLFNEWHNGSLVGARPEEAFFVKCDRSTMTQSDLDNGRLVVLVGVATNKPGEFVTFRITVPTASTTP